MCTGSTAMLNMYKVYSANPPILRMYIVSSPRPRGPLACPSVQYAHLSSRACLSPQQFAHLELAFHRLA